MAKKMWFVVIGTLLLAASMAGTVNVVMADDIPPVCGKPYCQPVYGK